MICQKCFLRGLQRPFERDRRGGKENKRLTWVTSAQKNGASSGEGLPIHEKKMNKDLRTLRTKIIKDKRRENKDNLEP